MQNFNYIILTIILCSLLISCSREDEEQEIIAALIRDEICKVEHDTIRHSSGAIKKITTYRSCDSIVLFNTAGGGSYSFEPREYYYYQKSGLRSLNYSVYRDFLERNKTRIKINEIKAPGIHVESISQKELKDVMANGGRANFRKTFKVGGILYISRPGISIMGNIAIISVDDCDMYDGLCGCGTMYLLRKYFGKWIVVEQIGTWIS